MRATPDRSCSAADLAGDEGPLPTTAAAAVVRAARASLREPTRPVTPADVGGGRHLTGGSSYTHRPSTSGALVGSHDFLAACSWPAGSCTAADIWTAPGGQEAPAGAAHISRRTTTSAPSQQQQQQQSLTGMLPALPRRPLPADGARTLPALPRRPLPADDASTRVRAHSAGAGGDSRLSGLGTLAPLPLPLTRPLAGGTSAGLGDAGLARSSTVEASAVTARSSSSSSGTSSCLSRPASSTTGCGTASRGSSRGGDNGRGSSSSNEGPSKQSALTAADEDECLLGDAAAEHALAAASPSADVWRRDVLGVLQRLQGMALSAADAPAMLLACSELQCLLDTAADLGTLQEGLAAAAGDDCSSSSSSSVQEGIVRTLIRLVDSRRPDVLAKVGAMLLRVVQPGSAVLMPAVKMLYALSKDSSNDARFRHHGVLRPLLSTCAALSSSMQQEQQEQQEQQQQHAGTALLYCSGCLKNISANATNQKSLGRLSAVSTLSQVLAQQVAVAQAADNQQQQETAAQVCLQVTALLRNLAAALGNAALFVQHGGAALQALLSVLQAGFGSRDPALVLNASRCLGKLSLHAGCQECLVNGLGPPPLAGRPDQQQQPAAAVATLAGLLLQLDVVSAPQHWPAAVRVAFVLGNLTTGHAAACTAVAAVPGLLEGLPRLVLALVQQQLQQQQASPAGAEAAAAGAQTAAAAAAAEELLTKLLRLLANVAIDATAGPALAAKQDTADALAAVLAGYVFEAAEELVLTATAALTNLAFYASPGSQLLQMGADSALLLPLLPLLTSGSEEGAVEAARAVGNLTRVSPAARAALLACSEGPQPPVSEQAGTHHAAPSVSAGPYVLRSLVMLLDHSSWEVVASVAGALVNLTAAAEGGAALRGVGVAAALTAALQRACDSAAAPDSTELAEEVLACRQEAALRLLQCVANVAGASAAVVSDAVSGAAGPRCAEVSCSSADLTAFSAVVALLAGHGEHGEHGVFAAGHVQQMAQDVAQRLSQDWGV